MQRQSSGRQPLAQPGRRGGVVIVEVRPRRKELDRVEPRVRNRLQMRAPERRVMKQMGGNPESHGNHPS
jgi:hypothetical protein